mmetsp:Transcript_530/g.887  ORF Transcript_530/g.887 Transcript_530/m.887 type:complete len:909 (-) Transcript_530:554-3280(-)
MVREEGVDALEHVLVADVVAHAEDAAGHARGLGLLVEDAAHDVALVHALGQHVHAAADGGHLHVVGGQREAQLGHQVPGHLLAPLGVRRVVVPAQARVQRLHAAAVGARGRPPQDGQRHLAHAGPVHPVVEPRPHAPVRPALLHRALALTALGHARARALAPAGRVGRARGRGLARGPRAGHPVGGRQPDAREPLERALHDVLGQPRDHKHQVLRVLGQPGQRGGQAGAERAVPHAREVLLQVLAAGLGVDERAPVVQQEHAAARGPEARAQGRQVQRRVPAGDHIVLLLLQVRPGRPAAQAAPQPQRAGHREGARAARAHHRARQAPHVGQDLPRPHGRGPRGEEVLVARAPGLLLAGAHAQRLVQHGREAGRVEGVHAQGAVEQRGGGAELRGQHQPGLGGRPAREQVLQRPGVQALAHGAGHEHVARAPERQPPVPGQRVVAPELAVLQAGLPELLADAGGHAGGPGAGGRLVRGPVVRQQHPLHQHHAVAPDRVVAQQPLVGQQLEHHAAQPLAHVQGHHGRARAEPLLQPRPLLQARRLLQRRLQRQRLHAHVAHHHHHQPPLVLHADEPALAAVVVQAHEPLGGVEEVPRVVEGVEAHHVRAQAALQQLHAAEHRAEDLRGGERDVQEEHLVRPPHAVGLHIVVVDQLGHQHQVVVVRPHHVPGLDHGVHHVRDHLVHLLVGRVPLLVPLLVPAAGAGRWRRLARALAGDRAVQRVVGQLEQVHVVKSRPEQLLAEPVVVRAVQRLGEEHRRAVHALQHPDDLLAVAGGHVRRQPHRAHPARAHVLADRVVALRQQALLPLGAPAAAERLPEHPHGQVVADQEKRGVLVLGEHGAEPVLAPGQLPFFLRRLRLGRALRVLQVPARERAQQLEHPVEAGGGGRPWEAAQVRGGVGGQGLRLRP